MKYLRDLFYNFTMQGFSNPLLEITILFLKIKYRFILVKSNIQPAQKYEKQN